MAKKNIIGERVQKLRKLHQYTCEDLGKYCGCKRQRIYQIESEQSCGMEEDKINKMAYFLGCTPDYLQGLVEKTDELLQINTRTDEQGNSYIEKTVLKLSLVPGDFRSSLLQKVLCLEPERMYKLKCFLRLSHNTVRLCQMPNFTYIINYVPILFQIFARTHTISFIPPKHQHRFRNVIWKIKTLRITLISN